MERLDSVIKQFGSAPMSAVVIGGSGGIGEEFVSHLMGISHITVIGTSRNGVLPGRWEGAESAPQWIDLDVTAPESIEAFKEHLTTLELPPIRLVFCAMGLLHDGDMQPEKRLSELKQEFLLRSFAVNAIGPMLIARELLPLMPRKGRVVFASLSARVGSIDDNRLGGWYGYRASKAALNQYVKTLAIEWKRRAAESIAVALHPGTVDTSLSMPFQRNVPAGKLFSRERSATQLLNVLCQLTPEDSGGHFAWDGSRIPS